MAYTISCALVQMMRGEPSGLIRYTSDPPTSEGPGVPTAETFRAFPAPGVPPAAGLGAGAGGGAACATAVLLPTPAAKIAPSGLIATAVISRLGDWYRTKPCPAGEMRRISPLGSVPTIRLSWASMASDRAWFSSVLK